MEREIGAQRSSIRAITARLSIKSGVYAGDRAVGLWVTLPYGDFHASVEMDQTQIDPATIEPTELSPYAPSPAPTQAPSPANNPAIAHSPPAAQVSQPMAVAILLNAGLPQQSLAAIIDAGMMPKRLLQFLQEGWSPDQVVNLIGHYAQDEGQADGGRVERYADFPLSENIEDRREWDTGGIPRRWNFRANWDPDYVDRPARGLERQLGRDDIRYQRRYAQ